MDSIFKKVSESIPNFRHEKDEHLCLSKKSRTELNDILKREEKCLRNQKLLYKLPDKGEKIRKFHSLIQEELRKREEQERLCISLGKLNVSETKNDLDSLEWGSYEKGQTKEKDDETNPLKILATHSSSKASTQNNMEFTLDTHSYSKIDDNLSNVESYASKLINQLDAMNDSVPQRRFFTHKIVNKSCEKKELSNINSSSIRDDYHKAKQMLSLRDSIVIQQEQNKLLQEIEITRATERLHNETDVKIKDLPIPPTNYRICNAESDTESHGSHTSDEYEEAEGLL